MLHEMYWNFSYYDELYVRTVFTCMYCKILLKTGTNHFVKGNLYLWYGKGQSSSTL